MGSGSETYQSLAENKKAEPFRWGVRLRTTLRPTLGLTERKSGKPAFDGGHVGDDEQEDGTESQGQYGLGDLLPDSCRSPRGHKQLGPTGRSVPISMFTDDAEVNRVVQLNGSRKQDRTRIKMIL
jgi:hypothetical protein